MSSSSEYNKRLKKIKVSELKLDVSKIPPKRARDILRKDIKSKKINSDSENISKRSARTISIENIQETQGILRKPMKEPKINLKQAYASKVSVHSVTSYMSKAQDMLSVHQLSLPTISPEKQREIEKIPSVKIPCKDLTTKPERTSSSLLPRRDLDTSSSINSHFEGWLLPVAKSFKCYTTSTSEIKSTSIKSSSSGMKECKSTLMKIKPMGFEKPLRSPQESTEVHQDDKSSVVNKKRLKGPQWKRPCEASFVAGVPKPFVGTCPLSLEKISRMSKARQKFFLTQDPRKTHCLINPEAMQKRKYDAKKQFDTLSKMVKDAQNLCEDKVSEASLSVISDVIDLENPMQLDFQGRDYKNTYEKDEQDRQNQRQFRRINRVQDHKRLKVHLKKLVTDEQHEQKLKVPPCFDVFDRNAVPVPTPPPSPIRYGKLFRQADKPLNQRRLQQEIEKRTQKYKELFLKKQARDDQRAKEQQMLENEKASNLASDLDRTTFHKVLADIQEDMEKTFKPKKYIKAIQPVPRIFPHTMRETKQLKKTIKQEDRQRKDAAIIKKEFYQERLGEIKKYPEDDLEISSDSVKLFSEKTLSEQSTDDEDNLQVGQVGSKIQLRGFHFKLGDDIRGKLHKTERTGETRMPKTCITREQWLNELMPKKEPVKIDIDDAITKVHQPDDPQLNLFAPEFNFKVHKPKHGAVRDFIAQRLGRHYHKVTIKNLRISKPKLKYSVKKFNLIGYLYEQSEAELHALKKAHENEIIGKNLKDKQTILQYIEKRQKHKQCQKECCKRRRLELLGIPCKVAEPNKQNEDVKTDSDSDSEWVPERESDLSSNKEEDDFEKIEAIKQKRLDLRQRGNMPASKTREPTLRLHPRHPRNYAALRVPSEIFDRTVIETGIPHMRKLPEDKLLLENVDMPKRPYTDFLNARHHHDHWDPTQEKLVHVHYKSKIPNVRITEKEQKLTRDIMESFQMADPPCNAFVGMDLTLPLFNFDKMIAQHRGTSSANQTKEEKTIKVENLCKAKDYIYRSRPTQDLENLDYPGRKAFLDMLIELRNKLYSERVDEGERHWNIDREKFLEELEEDLKSIESCLTSFNSSEYTNFTNDSGSFLLMEGKTKVPMDYIRKSVVPFEEIQRSRFQAKPINVDIEESNPFRVLPFSGMRKIQQQIIGGKDNFFTFNTRLKNGLRLRLEVPVADVRQKLLGRGKNKHLAAVTTDIDANFVTELADRPALRSFKFKTGRDFIKDGLRLKFESMLIQGQIVRTKIYDRLNEQHWKCMQNVKQLYEGLFAKWEKLEYDSAMSTVYKVKKYYDTTDKLTKIFRDLEKELSILNMDIVFIEGHWIRRIMLQNFHYLMGDEIWRFENDWIHRQTIDENLWILEELDTSISRRSRVNIRQRDKDDAWAIKTYYENVYLENLHPILIVFPNVASFNRGIEKLKNKTFVSLLELHYTLAIHVDLQERLESFQDFCQQDLADKNTYVQRKLSKKYYLENRADILKNSTMAFVNNPVYKSFHDDDFLRHRAVIAEVFRNIVPATTRGSTENKNACDMVGMMSEVVVELLNKFEKIPAAKMHATEAKLRKERSYYRKLSKEAYNVERRIEMEMKKVVRNLEPPYKRPKREGKLQRLHLKKKVVKVIPPVVRITEDQTFFNRAFYDDIDHGDYRSQQDTFGVKGHHEQIVPFYFDHFLRINGYTPNYNFKTQIELRDGPEIDRIKIKSVIPEVMEKMESWEIKCKKIMEENISRHPKMYENIS